MASGHLTRPKAVYARQSSRPDLCSTFTTFNVKQKHPDPQLKEFLLLKYARSDRVRLWRRMHDYFLSNEFIFQIFNLYIDKMATVGGGQGRGGGAGGGGGGGDGPWRNPWDSKKIGGCGVSSSKDINVSWRAYLKYNFFYKIPGLPTNLTDL